MAPYLTTYNEIDKTWSGPKQSSIYNYDISVGRVIFTEMKNWPNNVCQINDVDGVTVTSGQCITWAIRIAQHLKERNLNHKDVIGIVAKNTTYIMPLVVACLMNTTPFHAVNPMLDDATVKQLFEITKPKLIFCDGLDYQRILSTTSSWQPEIFTLSDHIEGVPKIENLLDPTATEMIYEPEPLTSGRDQTVAILNSSGTTGLPKAICISNTSLIQEYMLINSESIMLTLSGIDWMTGLYMVIWSAVYGATRVITNKPFSPEIFVQMVKKYQINFAIIPFAYLSVFSSCPDASSESLASVRILHYAGGILSRATLDCAQPIFKNAAINSLYGMTEVGVITGCIDTSNRAADAGRLSPGIKVRIVDDEGRILTHNQVGEVHVQKWNAWNGYFGNPVETRRMQDSEGWFHTGDMGYFDDQNFLYIIDRKKDILRYQFLQYYPNEIQIVIAELPQVLEVCVVGIYDESYGDAAGALIVKRQGFEISANEIIDHVAKRLTGLQRRLHAGVCFIDKLPKNPNGKVIRKAAQDLFVSQSRNTK